MVCYDGLLNTRMWYDTTKMVRYDGLLNPFHNLDFRRKYAPYNFARKCFSNYSLFPIPYSLL